MSIFDYFLIIIIIISLIFSFLTKEKSNIEKNEVNDLVNSIYQQIEIYFKYCINDKCYVDNDIYLQNVHCNYNGLNIICFVKFKINKEYNFVHKLKIIGFNIPFIYSDKVLNLKGMTQMKDDIGDTIIRRINPLFKHTTFRYNSLFETNNYYTH